jgi:hypothetical protein
LADDLGRSCELPPYPPQMRQLISMPFCATEEDYSPNAGAVVSTDVEDARRILDTVSRWEGWR